MAKYINLPLVATFLAVTLSCLPMEVRAQATLPLVGSFDTYGPVDTNDVVVDGEYAYVVTDNNSNGASPEFYIFNILNPASPLLVGSLDVGSSVTKVRVADRFAYLTTRSDSEEVVVVNIVNKSNPTKVSGLNLNGPADAIALEILDLGFLQQTIYVGTVNSAANPELYVIKLYNPASPTIVATYDVGADVNGIKVEGTFLHLATSKGNKEYQVLDISLAPAGIVQERYSYDLPGAATAIDGKEAKFFVVTGNNAAQPDLFSFDFSNSASPSFLGALDLQASHTGISLYGSRAYVSSQDANKQLQVVNISNPNYMNEVARYSAGDKAYGVFAKGSHALLATANNTKEFQIVETLSPAPQASAVVPATRPNIILILSDDQRWDSLEQMPTVMNEFVARGLTFRNGFTAVSLCAPSRASILTGQYPSGHGVKGNSAPEGGATVFSANSTLATWLKQAGYRTSYMGKYLNQYNQTPTFIPPGWDDWFVVSSTPNFFNYAVNDNGSIVNYGGDSPDYLTDVLKEKAVNFIQSSGNAPYFLIFAPYAPHVPATPAPRHDGVYANLVPFRPVTWQEAEIDDKPIVWRAFVNNWIRDAATLIPSIDALNVNSAGSLSSLDEAVGEIIEAVDNSGQGNDTLIVYTSDNGLSVGEHWLPNFKRTGYEESIRAPLLIRYPAIIRSARFEDRMALTVDLAPTFMEFAGLSMPGPVHGRSMVDLIKGSESSWRSDILVENWNLSHDSAQPPCWTVRNKRWKYIKTDLPAEFEELYDLENDPYEMRSVSSAPANAQILVQMRARLAELRAQQ